MNTQLQDYASRKGIETDQLRELADLDLAFTLDDLPNTVHQMERSQRKYEKQSLGLTMAFETLTKVMDENIQLNSVLDKMTKSCLRGYFEMGMQFDSLVDENSQT